MAVKRSLWVLKQGFGPKTGCRFQLDVLVGKAHDTAANQGAVRAQPQRADAFGNLFSALLAWLSARSAGGELVLVEDLDPDRCRRVPAQLADDLRWLAWTGTRDMSGAGRGDHTCRACAPVLTPRRSGGWRRGGWSTPATALGPSGWRPAPPTARRAELYPGKCRDLTETERRRLEAEGRRPAWRVRVPRGLGLYRRAYGAVHAQSAAGLRRFHHPPVRRVCLPARRGGGRRSHGVTQVVRGRDLLDSTPRQLYLYRLLGLTPPEFFHVPLLTAPRRPPPPKREQDLIWGAAPAVHPGGADGPAGPSGRPAGSAGAWRRGSWRLISPGIRCPGRISPWRRSEAAQGRDIAIC